MESCWPEWWDWDLDFTPHLIKRMEDRNFNEIDLRTMLNNARNRKADVVEGRWIIETKHKRHLWHVIVEPDKCEKLLVVITAYPVWD